MSKRQRRSALPSRPPFWSRPNRCLNDREGSFLDQRHASRVAAAPQNSVAVNVAHGGNVPDPERRTKEPDLIQAFKRLFGRKPDGAGWLTAYRISLSSGSPPLWR